MLDQMGRLPLITAIAATVALAGCDSNARFSTDVFRQPAPPVVEVEPAPDARQIVRDNLATMFAAASAPTNVAVSRPVRHNAWMACVRATVSGMTNARLGVQTFAIVMERGKIIKRERTDPTHWCASESYEPI
jgi:hypothetical protein